MARQVVVTGAASDIGTAVCRRFLSDGWSVVAVCRSASPGLSSLACERLVVREADFADAAAVDRLVDAEPGLFLASDALVTLAANRDIIPFAKIDGDDILRHFTVTAVSAFLLVRRLGPAMAERGWGRIVQTSSIGVKFGGGDTSFCYSLAKHALEFMPSAVKGWAGRGVLMNSLRIGITDTRGLYSDKDETAVERRIALVPAKRAATPDEVADLVHMLGSERNGFITGELLTFAGGE